MEKYSFIVMVEDDDNPDKPHQKLSIDKEAETEQKARKAILEDFKEKKQHVYWIRIKDNKM